MPQTFTFRRKDSPGHTRPGEAADYIQAVLRHPDFPNSKQEVLRRCVLTCAAASSPFDLEASSGQTAEEGSGDPVDDPEVGSAPKRDGGPTAADLAREKEQQSAREDGAPPQAKDSDDDRDEKTKRPFYKRYTGN